MLDLRSLRRRLVTSRSSSSTAEFDVQPVSAAQNGLVLLRRMQDQLIVFMALARGTSRMLCRAPTLHTQTAMAIAQQMTGAQFHLERRGIDLWLLVCGGAAVQAARQMYEL